MAAIAFGAVAKDPQVKTEDGIVEGTVESGVDVFKGIPFAEAPVGDLRWKAPQPVKPWKGVRQAKQYGPNPMQQPIFGDMAFGTPEISEDCLYLNVWTPENRKGDKLPVLIYFNGGALVAGSGSEPRYAGLSLAKKGIVVVTANYREGIFGFFSHPELSAETEYKGSGNYGFMDMIAAIKWVKDNIAAFGGDPDKITVAGESAGSMATNALMASPLCKDLFAQAIGSSGSSLFYEGLQTLEQAEKSGMDKAKLIGKTSIKELREMPAQELMEKAQCNGMMAYCLDGYVMTEQPLDVYDAGEQMDIPVLIGGNSNEVLAPFVLRGKPAAVQTIKENVKSNFGDATDKVVEMYGIITDEDATGDGAIQLASDLFIGFTTWKWAEAQSMTGTKPVYRYNYTHPRPAMKVKGKVAGLAGGVVEDDGKTPKAPLPKGAVHSADIEYAMGNLDTNDVYDWQPDDYLMSEIFQNYYINFIKTGNPNGEGLTFWPPINGEAVAPVLQLDVKSKVKKDRKLEERYKYIDKLLR